MSHSRSSTPHDEKPVMWEYTSNGATVEVWKNGAIKIEIDGSTHIRSPQEWHELAARSFTRSASEANCASLLRRIRQWDMLDTAEDGGYWKREIDATLNGLGQLQVTQSASAPRKHDYHDREDGLCICKVCNGAEGELTTHCPGEPLPYVVREACFSGNLDFKDGRWVVHAASTSIKK